MEINTSITTLKKFNSNQLTKCTDAIIKAYKDGNKSVETIAKYLRKISEEKKYKDDFSTFREYCDAIGITDKYAYRIIDGLSFKESHEELEPYTLSQCIELKRSNNIDSLLENGIVLPSMSCNRLREIVNEQLKASLQEEQEEQEEQDEEQEELEEKVIDGDEIPQSITITFNDNHFIHIEDPEMLKSIYKFIKGKGVK